MIDLISKIPFRHISQFLEGLANDSNYEKKAKRTEKFFVEINKFRDEFIAENGLECVSV